MSIRFGRSGNGYDSSQVMETADDDWRQITDLAERRKIQNRLAQRNYRRKLRQRLEELERQAGETPTVTAPKAPKQPKKPTSAPVRTGTTGGRITKQQRKRANSGRSERESSTEEIVRTMAECIEPMSATTMSEASPITPSTSYGLHFGMDVRSFYCADFAPFFTTSGGCARAGLVTAGPKDQGLGIYGESVIHQHSQPISPATSVSYPEYPLPLPSSYVSSQSIQPAAVDPRFYMLNSKVWSAVRVGKIVNVEHEQANSPPQQWSMPETTQPMHVTDCKPLAQPQPYIDTTFSGCRDRVTEYPESERTSSWCSEASLGEATPAVWGETWEVRSSWEEGYAR